MAKNVNPVMARNPYFRGGDTAAPNSEHYVDATPVVDAQTYAAPQAYAPHKLMTYEDAMVKTLTLLLVVVGSGALTGIIFDVQILPVIAIASTVGALVFGIVASFQRMTRPWAAIAYAVLEGVALGSLTWVVNMFIPGIAFQAILATVAVVGVAAGLHLTGTVRTTARGRMFALIAMFAAVIFGVVNLILRAFGVVSGLGLQGGTLGLVVGVVMIFVASYVLIGDLEDIGRAVRNQAPAEFAWTCALGIVMTILWIYTEVLRILMILADES